jgi:FHA domain
VNHIQDLYEEYSRMRENGLDAKAALNALRSHIETLTKSQREELARRLRAYEADAGPTEPKTPKGSSIRPIAPSPSATPPNPDSNESAKYATSEMEQITWVTCPNCGKANQRHEVFCYACGQLLEPVKGSFDTQHFSDLGDKAREKDYFSTDSVLALRVRGSANLYELRPQNSDHELIVGRSTEGSAMAPDVDLKDRKGADLGVSRLHLSIRYDGENHLILVSDLGSANGSFINGQRLIAKEVRVLRHGDELRLGKLVLAVSFRHPVAPTQA